jgi:hypothetical protein
MDPSSQNTNAPVPTQARREWRPPVLTRLSASLTASGGLEGPDNEVGADLSG